MTTYVFIDCNNIQSYIFSSDRLKQICNASILISEQIEGKEIPRAVNSGELIRCGGGVTLVKFEGKTKTDPIILVFKSKIENIFSGYGLSVTITLFSTDTNGHFYNDVLKNIFHENLIQKTHPKKCDRPISSILMVPCELSGEGAAEFVPKVPKEKKRLSFRENEKRKIRIEHSLEKKLSKNFPGYSMPQELGGIVNWSEKEDFEDKSEGTSEKRLLGIIYADINGLGKVVEEIAQTETEYEKFCKELKEKLYDIVYASIENIITEAVKNHKPAGDALPVRILYLGGDDLAIAIQGCFALPLASKIVQKVEAETFSDKKLTISAGVVIAPYNYPILLFNRIGKELEQRAKICGKKQVPQKGLIDFCLIKNSAAGSLRDIRAGKKNDNYQLYGGPYNPEEINRLIECANTLTKKEFPLNKLKKLESLLYASKTAESEYKEWKEHLKKDEWEVIKEIVATDDFPFKDDDLLGNRITSLIDLIEIINLVKVGENGG